MIARCTEFAPDALRELARWLLRDEVAASQLNAYMSQLLDERLIELHAACRLEAMQVVRHKVDLSAAEVAAHFRSVAHEIETGTLPGICDIQQVGRFVLLPVQPSRPFAKVTLGHRHQISLAVDGRLSWLPEAIAAIAFTTVTLLLISSKGGERSLRLIAATLCVLIGILHASVAIHSLWKRAN